MNNYKWLLDAGHGGITKDGTYTTAPEKMYVFEESCAGTSAKEHGLTFYEGVNNRAIVDELIVLMKEAGFDYERVYDEILDTPLRERVAKANALHAKNKRCIYISIHSDAMPDNAHGKGSGFSIYTSKGETDSDTIAKIFCDTYGDYLKEFKFRKDLSDGDADFEEDFYVLRKTNCPAILIENLFFDNRREAEYLMSKRGRQKIADILFLAILSIENTVPLWRAKGKEEGT
jgi:N-acetylmuramoyl-L-alanine amidase